MDSIQDLFRCIPGLHMLTYAPDGTLLSSSSEEAGLFHAFFRFSDYPDCIRSYAKEHDAPYMISNYMGLTWTAVLEKESCRLKKIHILGPVFYTSFSEARLEEHLNQYERRGLHIHGKLQLLKAMKSLPQMSYSQFATYAMMLHYVLNGVYTQMEDFGSLSDYHGDGSAAADTSIYRKPVNDQTYRNIRRCEQLLLSEVAAGGTVSGESDDRESELRELLARGNFALMPTDRADLGNADRARRDSLITLCALECRTAIEAGVLPETAYAAQDRWIHEIESAHTPAGLNEILRNMHRDFCELVRNARFDDAGLSPAVRQCILYIRAHAGEVITAEALARVTNLRPYYLTRRFRAETGKTLKEYAKEARIRLAAERIRTSGDRLSDIAEELHFASYAQFCSDYKKIMGKAPGQER